MKLHAVQQDDITFDQFRDQKMLDVKIKDLRVNCAFDGHHRADPTEAQGAQDRNVGAVMSRLTDLGALTPWSAGVCPCHRCVDRELVDEDQSLDRHHHLFLLERGPLDRVGFVVALRLFFRDSPSASSARQIVAMLASTLARFFSCSHSSSRVAPGDSATNSVKIIKWSSFKIASTPPPWGSGAMSPRSRFWRSSLWTKVS